MRLSSTPFGVLFGTLIFLGRATAAAAPEAPVPTLAVTIRLMGANPRMGDPIPMEVTVKNLGAAPFEYTSYPGRFGPLQLQAREVTGRAVTDPNAIDQRGIAETVSLRPVTVPPGGSSTVVVDLNEWALIRAPGNYTVTSTFRGYFVSTHATILADSSAITVAVQPRSEKEMAAHVADLTAKLRAAGDLQVRYELASQLMFTGREEIVPALLESMRVYGGGFAESRAFLFYLPHSAAIRQAIMDDSARHGLTNSTEGLLRHYALPSPKGISVNDSDNNITAAEMRPLIARSLALDNPDCWAAGCNAALRYPDDSLTPLLIAMTETTKVPAVYMVSTPDGPMNYIAQTAIQDLAFNRTDESVQALKKLLQSPDPKIAEVTANGIRTSYLSGNSYNQGHRLLPGDFDPSLQKPEPKKN